MFSSILLIDIDECDLGTDVCHDDQLCMNTPGSYICISKSCTFQL